MKDGDRDDGDRFDDDDDDDEDKGRGKKGKGKYKKGHWKWVDKNPQKVARLEQKVGTPKEGRMEPSEM